MTRTLGLHDISVNCETSAGWTCGRPWCNACAGIDIFRFDDDGKVVEHWGVLQVVPDTAANDNGVFLTSNVAGRAEKVIEAPARAFDTGQIRFVSCAS